MIECITTDLVTRPAMVIDGDACTIVLPPDAEDPDLSRFLSAAELICEESIRGQGAA